MTARLRAFPGVAGRLILLLTLAAVSAVAASAQSGDDGGPLQRNPDVPTRRAVNNEAITKMSKAGLDEAIILQTIQAQPGQYDLAPDNLIELKNAGVSARVIAAMQARAAGLGVRATDEKPVAPALDEIGVYYKDRSGAWVPLKTERVVFKSSGWLKSAVTNNIIKRDMNGHLEGQRSPLKLSTGVELMIYAPAGTDAAEYDFIRFEEKKDAREFRTLTGGVFHSESGSARDEIEFNPKKVGPQMYSFTVPVDIQKGEYGLLPPGAANQRGFADTGKIFTFSIPE